MVEKAKGGEMRHVVAISGGKDSTAMALVLQENKLPGREYEYVITLTGDELPPMMDHYKAIERLLGQPLLRITTLTMLELIREQKMIPNFRARFCTRILKIEPFIEYMRTLPDGSVWYSGLRADEQKRDGVDLGKDLERFEIRYPLHEWGWGLPEVMTYLEDRNVQIPERTDCGCCFFQRMGEWHQLWIKYPARYQEYVDIEREMGHSFRSPNKDTWPAFLDELRQAFVNGRVPRNHKPTDKAGACAWCAR